MRDFHIGQRGYSNSAVGTKFPEMNCLVVNQIIFQL